MVIDSLLSEEDVMSMPDRTLEAFSKVFGVVVSQELYKYMYERDDNDPNVVEKLERVAGRAIMLNVFHLLAAERGVVKIANEYSLGTISDNLVDYDMLIEKLQWLKDNSRYLRSEIPSRTADDYNSACHLLEATNPNVCRVVKANKPLFCPPHEKATRTGMGRFISSNGWLKLLSACRFGQYCATHQVSSNNRRLL